jgi:N-acetylglucosaminyl-diphospho-decaprenol L-rhamnosyltransferase
MNKAVIVIVNWNTRHLLARCLKSLQETANNAAIAHVFVVDNASTDDSIAQARAAQGNLPITFTSLPHNSGFARANNAALRELQEKTPNTPVLLLNPDTEVNPGALPALLAVLAREPKAGIIGPRLNNPDHTLQPSVRAFPTLAVFLITFFKLNRLFPSLRAWRTYLQHDFDYTRQQTCDQVMGAAFLIRPEVLTAIGLLDEKFWIWFEEVDYCWRVQAAGWQILYTPAAQVTHHGGASFSQLIGIKRTLPWIQSVLRYTSKHLPWYQALLVYLLAPVGVFTAVLASLYHWWRYIMRRITKHES